MRGAKRHLRDPSPQGQRPRRRSNRSLHLFDLFKVVPSFFRISAGGAFCTTQRLAFVGQLRRPSAYVPSRSCDSSDTDIPFRIGRQDGEAVLRLITVAWREASPAGPISTRTTTPKAVEPFPTPIRPLQGRSLFFSYFRRWRILHHTAVSVCRTASPSLCICAVSFV